MKKLFLKIILISSPLLLILSFYIITDPFKVIYHYYYNNYYDWQPWELNRDFVTTENLKIRISKNDLPDSYIVGNSRSLSFHCNSWKQFLDNDSKPFHFDASSESLFGIYKKIIYLDQNHIPIKNLLWICDVSELEKTTNDRDLIHIKHPDVSQESKFAFQTTFIKGYFTNFFFFKHMDFMVNGKVKDHMKNIFLIEKGYLQTEAYENNYYYSLFEKELQTDSLGYYKKKANLFINSLGETISEPVIEEKQVEMLKEIAHILSKHGTNFKLVISPLYDKKRINSTDLNILKDLFSPETIFDYSGKNELTEFAGNYYDKSHYKPFIADKILSVIYKK